MRLLQNTIKLYIELSTITKFVVITCILGEILTNYLVAHDSHFDTMGAAIDYDKLILVNCAAAVEIIATQKHD